MKTKAKKKPAAKVKKPAAGKKKQKKNVVSKNTKAKKEMPTRFPFWARLKISKKRTTLVIDKEDIIDKKTKKKEAGFVHREATHTGKKEYEKIYPNPDRADPKPMYLKRPTKLPQRMFEPHNKELEMPEHLKEKYEKNNKA